MCTTLRIARGLPLKRESLGGVNREIEVHVAGNYEASVTPSYIDLRSIYVGAGALKDEHLTPGTITVLIEDDDEFSVEGALNAQGLLSGMAKLYGKLPLAEGTKIKFAIQADGSVIVRSPKPAAGVPAPGAGAAQASQTVFEAKNLKHIHIEGCRPENLDNWEPETETDVYLAFGVLQDFTDFQYCCGASKALLTKLGANYEEAPKPDAILPLRPATIGGVRGGECGGGLHGQRGSRWGTTDHGTGSQDDVP